MSASGNWRHLVLLATVLVSVVVVFLLEPMPQWPEYHDFADKRSILGVPNALDVLSNVPFFLVGMLGLMAVTRRVPGFAPGIAPSARVWERWPWGVLFVGITLTAPGSAWFHLEPNNATLVWDRLPMTVGFMGLLSVVLAERVSLAVARKLFGVLVLVGLASVFYWDWTESLGRGDLRPYGLVQFGSLAVVLLTVLLYPAREPGTAWLWGAIGCYALAKVLEATDVQIFSIGEVVSGHTLKHLAAGAGSACLLAMFLVRQPLGSGRHASAAEG